MRQPILACLLLALTAAADAAGPIPGQGTWLSTLHGRDLDGNPATVEAWYDSALGITWLADAGFANTSGLPLSGQMTWDAAMAWVGSLNPYGSGVTGWRLPVTIDTGNPGCDYANSGTDCGYNVNPGTGEMPYLFYVELGDRAAVDTTGHAQAGAGLGNTGPFVHMVPPGALPPVYWSSTQYVVNTNGSWYLDFSTGSQGSHLKTVLLFAWPVHDGDVGGPVTDSDGDGVPDGIDNCVNVPNPTQLDADGDGYGNACDADLDNNGAVTATDFALLRSVLGQPASFSALAAAADLDGNGTVTATDFALLRKALGKPPGPSGLHPNCPPTCP